MSVGNTKTEEVPPDLDIPYAIWQHALLAALFHTFTGAIRPIDLEAMESGCTIAAWHLSEARRFLGELAMPPELAKTPRTRSVIRVH
jgi:hypothetical protein